MEETTNTKENKAKDNFDQAFIKLGMIEISLSSSTITADKLGAMVLEMKARLDLTKDKNALGVG